MPWLLQEGEAFFSSASHYLRQTDPVLDEQRGNGKTFCVGRVSTDKKAVE